MAQSEYAVTDLLTHRPPMVLIDRVEDYDAESLVASVEIHEETPFLYGSSVPAYAGIEYMAQAVACHCGVKARSAQLPVRDGYLISTRRLSLMTEGYHEGSKLTVQCILVFDYGEMAAYDCRIHKGAKLLAKARLNVYQPSDPSNVDLRELN